MPQPGHLVARMQLVDLVGVIFHPDPHWHSMLSAASDTGTDTCRRMLNLRDLLTSRVSAVDAQFHGGIHRAATITIDIGCVRRCS